MNFKQRRQILHDYILIKLDEGDYHAVSDAANDIRVLEARNLYSHPEGHSREAASQCTRGKVSARRKCKT